jgi:hypothetical protein
VLYPIASVWSGFSPTRHPVWRQDGNPDAAAVDNAYQQVTREMLAARRDFDYVDEASLARAPIAAGTLRLAGNRVSLLVLPRVTTLRMDTLQSIARFVRSGGTVVSYEAIPSRRADRGALAGFHRLVDALWTGRDTGCGRVVHVAEGGDLPAALAACGMPDVRVEPATHSVYYQHRALPDGDIYFVVNNDTAPLSALFSFRARGRAEVWDPLTGTVQQRPARASGPSAGLHLDLPARGGLLVVFRK